MYKNVGYISQNSNLLPIALKHNISLEDNCDEEKIVSIMRKLNLDHLVPRINLMINEKQDNLSGGEMQRILLARLLYKDRNILFFDEFTSSLDPINAFALEKYILDLEEKTILHITHKYSEELFPLNGEHGYSG